MINFRARGIGVIHQYLAAMTAAVSMLMVGMSISWPSPVLPMILSHTAPIEMDDNQISWMVSLLFLGNTLSPLPVGWLMDRIGRKRTMSVLNLFPFCAWLLTYSGESYWFLYLARFLNGLWSGASYTVCAIYIGEIAEPSLRGSLSNFNNLFKTLGGLAVFVIGPYISYKALALMCCLVPAIFFIMVIFIPESPYFLLMKKRNQEAKDSLRWLRHNKEQQQLETELAGIEMAISQQSKLKGNFKNIFTDRACRKAFWIAMTLSFVKTISGYDIMMAYLSITLPKSAFELFGPNECVIALGVISLMSCILSSFLLDKFPRRVLLTVSSVGCCLTTFLAGVWFLLVEKTDINVQYLAKLPFYCFAVHAVTYAVGLGPIIANVKGELFAVNVKSLCSAIITITFALLNFIATKLYLLIAHSLGMYLNYFIYSVGCGLGTLYVLFYVIETKGKTLHEIQTVLRTKR